MRTAYAVTPSSQGWRLDATPTRINSCQDVSMVHERELRVGREYSVWPYLKWGNADRLAHRLRSEYQMWRASLGLETRAEYSDDRRTVTFYANIATSAPTHEWSLAFGDIIHNYRSALDSLAWAMAHLDGRRPDERDAAHIYFPIKKTFAQFDSEARGRLKSVPGFVLTRMEQVQPYHVLPGQAVDDGIALILHDLDIEDKHKAALETRAVAADRTTYGIVYKPLDRSTWVESADSMVPEWLAPERAISNSDPIVRWTFRQPVEEAEIPDLPLRLVVERKGKKHDVFELLHLINQQIAETFAIIETGKARSQWSAKPEPKDSR